MPSVVLLWLHKPRAYLVILKTTECSRQGTEAICSHIVMGHTSVCVCVPICRCIWMGTSGSGEEPVETIENITLCTEYLPSLAGPLMPQQENIVSPQSP